MSGNKKGQYLLYKGYYTKNLDRINAWYLHKNFDWVHSIDGFERLGKTTLGVKTCIYLDPSFSVNQVCFTPDQYMAVCETIKKGKAVLYDEAGTGLFSREAMQRKTIAINKMLMTIGSKRLFHCILLPNFLKLDGNIAENRVMSLCHVTWRGEFKFYSRKRLRIIAQENNFFAQRPNFTGKFPDKNKADGFDWAEYEKRKRSYLKDFFMKEYGISDLAASTLEQIIEKVKLNPGRYSNEWRGKKHLDKALLRHDFGLSMHDAEKVKKVVQRYLTEQGKAILEKKSEDERSKTQ